ncbi:MAG TPA: SgcJ/EcaC family oxidoreductase [Rudaea sp.]
MNRMICSLLIALPALAAAAPVDDEKAIRELQVRQERAWNQHDAAAYASLFTADGDVVNLVGWWWRGRAQIQSKLTAAFAVAFRDSTLTLGEIDVRSLNPTVAVAHVRWTMTGAKTPPGVPEPRQGIEVQVLQKQDGKWLIASFQNTVSVTEVPFPTAPPHASQP